MTPLADYVLQLLTNATEPVSALSGEQAGSTTSPPPLEQTNGLDARVPSGGFYLDEENV